MTERYHEIVTDNLNVFGKYSRINTAE